MMPGYRFVESNPFHGSHEPYGYSQYVHPYSEPFPPHMRADPSRSAVISEPCPSPYNYAYSAPWHGCCFHGNYPGYYGFRPPFPQTSPSQYHCCGHHPSFPVPYPIAYGPSTGCQMYTPLPRYEYEKVGPRENVHHCCGCPNHSHDLKNVEHVQVEDGDSNVEKKAGGSPLRPGKDSYPIRWIPPENWNEKVQKTPTVSEMDRQGKLPQDMMHQVRPKEHEQEPRLSGWYPFDINNLWSLLQDGQQKAENNDNRGKRGQRQFPVIWLPCSSKNQEGDEEDKDKDTSSKPLVMGPGSVVKYFPLNFSESGNNQSRPRVIEENTGSDVPQQMTNAGVLNTENAGVQVVPEVKEKTTSQRSIPVKQVKEPAIHGKIEGHEGKDKEVIAETKKDNGAGIAATNGERQSTSPSKASKLPPICLRVDPLPKKKNGNSRSPSPSGVKDRSKDQSQDASKLPTTSDLQSKLQQDKQIQDGTVSSNKEAGEKKNKVKFIEVLEQKNDGRKNEEDKKCEPQVPSPPLTNFESVVGNLQADKNEESKCASAERDLAAEENRKNTNKVTESVVTADGEYEKQKTKLSEEAAAVLIQSAYRGFEVRKCEPLRKLKQLAEVRKQMADLRSQIHSLESSSDLKQNDRRKIVIGEMIMNLLLKLDTIQGLNPSLRDARKSLAKELIKLQEGLDTIVSKKYEEKELTRSSEEPSHDSGSFADGGENKEVADVSCYLPLEMSSKHDENKESVSASPVLNLKDERGESMTNGEELVVSTDSKDKLEIKQHEVTSQEPPVKEASSQQHHPERQTVAVELGELQEQSEPDAMNESNKVASSVMENVFEEPQDAVMHEEDAVQEGTTSPVDADNKDVESDKVLTPGIDLIISEEIPKTNEQVDLSVLGTGKEGVKEKQSEILLSEFVCGGDEEQKAAISLPPHNIIEEQLMQDRSIPVEEALEDVRTSMNEEISEVAIPGGDVKEPQASEIDMNHPEILSQNNMQQAVAEEMPENRHIRDETMMEEEVLEETKGMNNGDREASYEMLEVMITADENKEQAWDGNTHQATADGKGDNVTCAGEELKPQEELDQLEQDEAVLNLLFEEGEKHEMTTCVIGSLQEKIFQVKEDEGDKNQIPIDGTRGSTEAGETLHEPETLSSDDKPQNGSENVQPDLVSSPEHNDQNGDVKEVVTLERQQSMDSRNSWTDSDAKLVEENEKLRKMMEKLIEMGKDQFTVISNLTERVKDLEKQLSQKKKARARRGSRRRICSSFCSRKMK